MPTSVAALALFFLSGFAALLYQVIWQRLLAFFSGADVYSATIVVASFMAGIGCGSFAGGHVADRVTRAQSVALFAAAEMGIAVFGYFSKHLFYDVLYLQYGELARSSSVLAAVLFVALLFPTFLMGASLPLLSRGLTRDVQHAASTVGWLYAVNTGGAALGAFAGTWIIIPQAGLDGSLRMGASLNLICALTAAPLAWMVSMRASEVVRPSGSAAADGAGAPPGMLLWIMLFGMSGFVGLSLEIVWFRLLGVVLKSTFFAFGTMLAVYLAGLGLGGAIGGVVAARVRRPAQWFLFLQAGAGFYAALSLIVFVSGLHAGGAFEWFGTYLRGYDGVNVRAAILRWLEAGAGAGQVPGDLVRVYLLLPAALILPPTVMAGMSLPLLQRVVQRDLDRLGRRVGLLLTANVIGSTAGAAITGLLLLDWLGTGGTVRLLSVLSLAFAGVAIAQTRTTGRWRRVAAFGTLAAVAALLVASVPTGKALWSRLHGTTPNLIFVEEDGSGVSLLRGERRDFRQTTVMVNGLGQSWLPYGGLHTALGALPAFIHDHPRRAALIGLGSGDTLYALAGRRELESIISIEIVGTQITTLRELAAWQGYPGLLGILNDPRIRHVEADGRRYLSGAQESFDIIEADALRPYGAYAGNLYSDAYFRLLRRRLAPGGIAVSWAPTGRVLHTFLAVFPHVVQQGEVVIGSDRPIRVDREAIARRLADPRVAQHYTAAGINIVEELKPFLAGEWRVYQPSEHRRTDDLNTDLHPRDELDIPAILRLPGLRLLS